MYKFEAPRPSFSDHFDALNLKIFVGTPVEIRDYGSEGIFVLASTNVSEGVARLERLTHDGNDVVRLTVWASAVTLPSPSDLFLWRHANLFRQNRQFPE